MASGTLHLHSLQRRTRDQELLRARRETVLRTGLPQLILSKMRLLQRSYPRQMCDGDEHDVASRALLLRPMRKHLWRGRIPREEREALLQRGLLQYVCSQMWRLWEPNNGELYFRPQRTVASRMFRLQGLQPAFQWGFILRPRRSSLLRDSLPCQKRLSVRRLQQTHYWSLHHGYVPQVPSRTFPLCFLPAATEQGYIQGTEQQTLLPQLFRQTLRIRTFPCSPQSRMYRVLLELLWPTVNLLPTFFNYRLFWEYINDIIASLNLKDMILRDRLSTECYCHSLTKWKISYKNLSFENLILKINLIFYRVFSYFSQAVLRLLKYEIIWNILYEYLYYILWPCIIFRAYYYYLISSYIYLIYYLYYYHIVINLSYLCTDEFYFIEAYL